MWDCQVSGPLVVKIVEIKKKVDVCFVRGTLEFQAQVRFVKRALIYLRSVFSILVVGGRGVGRVVPWTFFVFCFFCCVSIALVVGPPCLAIFYARSLKDVSRLQPPLPPPVHASLGCVFYRASNGFSTPVALAGFRRFFG